MICTRSFDAGLLVDSDKSLKFLSHMSWVFVLDMQNVQEISV